METYKLVINVLKNASVTEKRTISQLKCKLENLSADHQFLKMVLANKRDNIAPQQKDTKEL